MTLREFIDAAEQDQTITALWNADEGVYVAVNDSDGKRIGTIIPRGGDPYDDDFIPVR